MTDQRNGCPVEIEPLLASCFEVLKERGAAREIAILVASEPRIEPGEHDNWNGGTDYWDLTLPIDLALFSRLTEDERAEAAKVISDVLVQFFAEFSNDHLGRVTIVPRAHKNENWRKDAATYLAGGGVSNQGRVRSDNIAAKGRDGLLFRSEAEIHLYLALKELGVVFAPLPVFLRGGNEYVRLEPDFVLLKDGVFMVVEVDGDTYHRESPADAHSRLLPLDHEGAKIERIKADQCSTLAAAKVCAGKLYQALNKRIAQRR